MEIKIEKYTESDREAILLGIIELQNFEVPLSDTRVLATRESALSTLEHLLEESERRGGAFLCGHSEGQLIGFIICSIESEVNPNETADSTTFGYISDVFVFEQFRGKGIFKLLNIAAEEHLSQYEEVKRIRINVLANNAQALRAYRSAGYSDYEIMLEKRIK